MYFSYEFSEDFHLKLVLMWHIKNHIPRTWPGEIDHSFDFETDGSLKLNDDIDAEFSLILISMLNGRN